MAFQENLNASICMFSFFRSHRSNVSHGWGCRAGFFPSLFMWSYDQDGELEDVPHPPRPPPPPRFFFGVNLDYLDFSGGIFDLFYEPVREKTNNLGFDQV